MNPRIPEYELKDPETRAFLEDARNKITSSVGVNYFDPRCDSVVKWLNEEHKAVSSLKIRTVDIPDLTDKEINDLVKEMTKEYNAILKRTGSTALAKAGVAMAFNLKDPRAVKWMALRGATLIKGIDKNTINQLRIIIAREIDKGSALGVIEKAIVRQFRFWKSAFPGIQSRANLIARTETAYAANAGTLIGYAQSERVEQVKVYDDEGPRSCINCKEANGKIWLLQDAMKHPLAHPNCVRAFSAIVKI